MTTETFNASTSWECPAGVTEVTVECEGAGGGGDGGTSLGPGGGGGGGGAYASSVLTVVPGNFYSIVVGTGGGGAVYNTGAVGGTGGDSSFDSTSVVAAGGTGASARFGGAGGTTAASTGTTKVAGTNGTDSSAGSGTAGGAGGAGATSGSITGGAGGTGGVTGSLMGQPGTAPGGGGGGGRGAANSTAVGGNGADGRVVLTYATAIEISGEAFTTAATMLDGAPVLSIVVDGEAFTAATTALDGVVESGYADYATEVAADNPMIWWRLGESSGTTAADASGNSHPGTYVNTPTLGVAGALAADADTAVAFAAASSEEVQVAYFSALNITTFTMEAWVKTTGSNMVIMGRQGTTVAPYVLLVGATGKLTVIIKTSGTSGPTYTSTGVTINDGNWHHVAAVRDGTLGAVTDLWFYVDGALDYSVDSLTPSTATSQGFTAASRGGTPFLDGSLDEVALYDTPLSAARIAAHYISGTTDTGPITISGEAFTSSATALDGAVNVGIVVAGEAFSAAAVALDGTLAGTPITIAGEAFAASAVALDGTIAIGEIVIAGEAFTSAVTMLDGSPVRLQNLPPADLTLTATTPAGARTQNIPPADLLLSAPNPLIHRAILITTRWTFYDPVLDETWTMPINPDSMSNPTRGKVLTFGRNARYGRHTTTLQAPRPLDWEFAGVIRTQEHHDTLTDWVQRRRIIHVTDHVHRKYEVLLTDFQVTERAPTRNVRWRLRYSMKALLLRQLS